MTMLRSCNRRTLLAGATLALTGFAAGPLLASATAETVTLYKDPNCGCCQNYADYLRKNGFEVKVVPTNNLGEITAKAGIPADFAGCHTFKIGHYAFGGHIPIAILTRFLNERPQLIGLTVPGMPAGSPGMGGKKTEPLKVYAVAKGQAPTIYAVD